MQKVTAGFGVRGFGDLVTGPSDTALDGVFLQLAAKAHLGEKQLHAGKNYNPSGDPEGWAGLVAVESPHCMHALSCGTAEP